ncbi:nuclear transport factor 2 family protein [Rhodococcus sp. TAF43]|uniref:nuclear transport factor 2 family protein n=1 Tax=unclassified Rhodococcus (in: high G+C Gram-positive bacteria) TaxID=192944 RepID=UPI001582DA55|nr:nuclear transport factor 2 family protein [Rhodococcus sp. W8901]QKT10139.1 nuclear transport factor 2 family protein [Rhodococcus sp. W8901]
MHLASDSTVPDIETRLAIQALTAEHAYRLDHGSADTLHELYSHDGELIGLPPRDLIGNAAIAQWGEQRARMTRTARHIETNHRLEWRDGILHGTLYATVYRSDSPDTTNTSPFMVGDYDDEYVLDDGRWKIRRRIIRRGFRVAASRSVSGAAQ